MRIFSMFSLSVLFLLSLKTYGETPVPNVHLGTMTIQSLSFEGSFRGAVVLKGDKTPYFRIDCIDRGDIEGRRTRNTVLIIDSTKKIGRKNHQFFTGVNDFYCQGIGTLFMGLREGDKVDVCLNVKLRTNDYRGGTEFADIKLLQVTVNDKVLSKKPYLEKKRDYDLTVQGQMVGFFTSQELLHPEYPF